MRRVGMFSGGRFSWAACKRSAVRDGVADMTLLMCDTKEECADTYRYANDAAANVGLPITMIADGRGIWELFREKQMIGNTRVAKCAWHLKREVADRWLNANCDRKETVIILGYGPEERERGQKTIDAYSEKGWSVEMPLWWHPCMSAGEVKQWEASEGLREQALYREGFAHANCGGACVKMGQGGFAHLLNMRPATYARWEAEEEATRQHIGKDVAILRDRRGGKTRPLTLRALRERIEGGGKCDPHDMGGCDCFGG